VSRLRSWFENGFRPYLFFASNLALHFSQQKETVFPSLPLLVMEGSASLPLIGHLSAARPAEANERAAMVSSVFMDVGMRMV